MNSSNALALAFAASIACLPVSGAAEGLSHWRPDQRHPHFHRRATAPQLSPTQTLSQGAPTHQQSTDHPLVRHDSDGLSRNPENCNLGCIDSAE